MVERLHKERREKPASIAATEVGVAMLACCEKSQSWLFDKKNSKMASRDAHVYQINCPETDRQLTEIAR